MLKVLVGFLMMFCLLCSIFAIIWIYRSFWDIGKQNINRWKEEVREELTPESEDDFFFREEDNQR